MRGLEQNGTAALSELSNLRFLAERQLRVIDDLDRRGLDGREARALLARLMRRHEDLLPRAEPPALSGSPAFLVGVPR